MHASCLPRGGDEEREREKEETSWEATDDCDVRPSVDKMASWTQEDVKRCDNSSTRLCRQQKRSIARKREAEEESEARKDEGENKTAPS